MTYSSRTQNNWGIHNNRSSKLCFATLKCCFLPIENLIYGKTCNSKEDVGKVRPEKNMMQEEWMKFEKTKQFSFAKFKWHWKSKTTQFLFIQFPKKIAKSNGVTL